MPITPSPSKPPPPANNIHNQKKTNQPTKTLPIKPFIYEFIPHIGSQSNVFSARTFGGSAESSTRSGAEASCSIRFANKFGRERACAAAKTTITSFLIKQKKFTL